MLYPMNFVEVQFDHVRPPAKQRQGTRAGDTLLWNSDGCHMAPPAVTPAFFKRHYIKSGSLLMKTMSIVAFRISYAPMVIYKSAKKSRQRMSRILYYTDKKSPLVRR
jgi:hypothetical protein